jgi:DNA-binding NarL/FixJ family response regulator
MQPQQRLIETLSSLLIQINALHAQSAHDPERLNADLNMLGQIAREALYIARTLSETEREDALANTTLAEALSHLVEDTAEQQGFSSRIALSGVDEQGHPPGPTLSYEAEHTLYLLATEALYQVRNHQGTRRLRLTLNYGTNEVIMSIEDDGIVPQSNQAGQADDEALAPPFTNTETRIASYESTIFEDLRYRLETWAGTLEITTDPERGTRVRARMPYTLPQHALPQREDIEHAESSQNARETSQPAQQVRILLVEHQTVTRVGLRHLLETYPGIQVIGEAADSIQAVSEALELGPQVVLMDTQLPDGQSLEALRQIKQLNQDIKVLLLSTQDREEYLYETLRAGADGYVLKDIEPDDLVMALRAVARGEVLVQPQLASRLLSHVGRQGTSYNNTLTTRELEVLRLLAKGLRNKEIAARLYVSERTVNFHLANIYQKLNVSGRTEALSKAIEQGLITA